MGSIYPRGNLLWLAFVDAGGKRRLKSSGLLVGREAEARATLEAIERQVAAEIRHEDEDFSGPPTVASYAKRFVKARKAAGIGSASQEEARFRDYVNPFEVEGRPLGSMPLKDVRPHHIRDFVRHLKAMPSPRLAPRTVRHIYGHLRTLFHEAVTDELVSATPCVLKKGELPKKIDKDPTWRARAVFSREEVELLGSSEAIPELRRVRYHGLFESGMRIGELAERKWSEWDAAATPLGMLTVSTSYSRKQNRVKGVKTEQPRLVPVHPTLAKVLAGWKLSGWERTFGRPPRPDDLIFPSASGKHLRDTVVLREFHADCQAVGLRLRRTHDTRRTFISLALADGANKDILRQVTHGAQGDQVDQYTTLPWATVCAEVSKLKIKLLEGQLLALPVALQSGVGGVPKMPLQSPLQSEGKSQKTLAISGRLARKSESGRGGTRNLTPRHQETTTGAKKLQFPEASPSEVSSARQVAPIDRSNVAGAIAYARAEWIAAGNVERLKQDLQDILNALAGDV